MKKRNLPTQPGAVLFHKKSGSFAVLTNQKIWLTFDYLGVFGSKSKEFKDFKGWKLVDVLDSKPLSNSFVWNV
jgi:hypothetical protein